VENKWQSKIISAIALVATTQLASFPIIFYNFHQYSLISWLANFVIVPVFSTLILPFALLILILGTINLTFVIVLAAVMSHILQLMFRAIEWSASLTGLHFYGNIASGFAVLIFYITLTWLIFRSQLKVAFISFRSKQLIFQTEKISALILAIVLLVAALLPNPTEITFIDVGQGDSAFIRTTTGQTILIDSGGTLDYAKEPWQQRDNPFEVGARIVWPFLRYEGVNQLDYALLTHEDVDHLRGFFAVLEKVKVDIFIVPAGFPQTNLGRQLAAQLTTKQIPTYQVEQAVSINIDDTSKLTLLPAVLVNSTKANDRSYAILAEFHNSRIIFAADIESSGEELLLDKYQLPSVDILKVGHHGSRSSTTEKWLAALQPNNAIISVGSNNCYGHPAPEVLERLAESGARPATIIWRTDLQGSVQVKIIGDKVQISQFGR
jgi:competence protein ComEC